MSVLATLKPQFQSAFPRLASANYVHFILLRHSQSFPIFQTDGVLNTVRTQAGLKTKDADNQLIPFISRLVMFKRKQTSPERLLGRELLRSLNLITSEGEVGKPDNFCRYGGEKFCGKCPDCVIYGFAVGDSGSERSKVYSDSTFSLSPYEKSHHSFTFNFLSEAGTMMLDSDDSKRTDKNKTRSSINELDHILPEVTFPTVETLRDSTYEGFIYVLGNLLRTKRYGAQESRTGTMKNHLIGVAFCDGEIFSNLHFTQAIYDALEGDLNKPIDEIITQAQQVAQDLLEDEPVRKIQTIFEEDLNSLVKEVSEIYQDETLLTNTLSTLYEQTQTYSETFGALSGKKRKSKGK
jgi:CRISPR-associated protein Csc2